MYITYSNERPSNNKFLADFDLSVKIETDPLKPEIKVEGDNYIIPKQFLVKGEPLSNIVITASANTIAKQILTGDLNKQQKLYASHQLNESFLDDSDREDRDYLLILKGIVEYFKQQ